MKICAICGTPTAEDVATCPSDGEASWSCVASEIAVLLTPDEAMELASTDVETIVKRGPGRPRK